MKCRLIGLMVFAQMIGSSAFADATTISDVFKKVKNSVVVIHTLEKDVVRGPNQALVNIEGLGSGVLISLGGMVITASHVVQTADHIFVTFPSGERIEARVVGSEPIADVALLELAHLPENPQPAQLGNSDTTEVGEEIFIVGAPFGISHTLTVGHISARRQSDANTFHSGFSLGDFFQTDAAVNEGNSGGPLFNLAGEVIGIVSHIVSSSNRDKGLTSVMTSNMAKRLLLDEKSVWSGVWGYLLEGELAIAFNLPQPAGFLVQRVAKGSLADRAGLKGGTIPATVNGEELILGGDIVLDVLGIPVERKNHAKIAMAMSQQELGNEISLTVLRGGKKVELGTMRLRSP